MEKPVPSQHSKLPGTEPYEVSGPWDLAATAHPELRYGDLELLHGLEQGQFRLAYQPKLHSRTGEMNSAEALVRWQHPVIGLLMPDRFIDRCEDSGTITQLTLWTLQQAVKDQVLMREQGHDIRIYVNLSAQLLTEERVVEELIEIAERPDVDLGLEVTERSVISDPRIAFDNIRRLRDVGYAIAIDDYGSGLSSLTYLKHIDADELKIDKGFVLSLATSHRDPLIVRSTIDLAHALGMTVTAEGVETQAAHALLTVMGCDVMQGYLIGRPVPIKEFLRNVTAFDLSKITFPHDISALTNHKIWKRA